MAMELNLLNPRARPRVKHQAKRGAPCVSSTKRHYDINCLLLGALATWLSWLSRMEGWDGHGMAWWSRSGCVEIWEWEQNKKSTKKKKRRGARSTNGVPRTEYTIRDYD
jgi:hypothetical protein